MSSLSSFESVLSSLLPPCNHCGPFNDWRSAKRLITMSEIEGQEPMKVEKPRSRIASSVQDISESKPPFGARSGLDKYSLALGGGLTLVDPTDF